jgi:hypothetical protein
MCHAITLIYMISNAILTREDNSLLKHNSAFLKETDWVGVVGLSGPTFSLKLKSSRNIINSMLQERE